MVTNSALAAVCIETGLYKHVIYESPQLGDEIDEYARQVARARDLEYKVADNEGRPPGQYWVDIESPKVSSDVMFFLYALSNSKSHLPATPAVIGHHRVHPRCASCTGQLLIG